MLCHLRTDAVLCLQYSIIDTTFCHCLVGLFFVVVIFLVKVVRKVVGILAKTQNQPSAFYMATAPSKIWAYLSLQGIMTPPPCSLFTLPSDRVSGQGLVTWASSLNWNAKNCSTLQGYHKCGNAVSFIPNIYSLVKFYFIKHKSNIVWC